MAKLLGYGMDDWRIESQQGLGSFLFTTTSRLALGPTQPPIKWIPGTPSLRLKQLGREADHSPPSSAEVKNAWTIPPLSNMPSWLGAQLRHRANSYYGKMVTEGLNRKIIMNCEQIGHFVTVQNNVT
jgi:hypothetical protein